jgi:Papain family cysteine protease
MSTLRRTTLLTSMLALTFGLGACQRGCHRHREEPRAQAVTAPPPAAKGKAPLASRSEQTLHYVQQRLEGGKFIAPLTPPPAAPPSAEPPLPDLPPISKHGRVPAPKYPAGDHPCGAVQVGDDVIPLDCMDPDYGHIEHATMPLVTYHQLHGGEMVLPPIVSHRDDGTEGAMRGQGGTGCCTAFSLASAVDHSMARWTGQPASVSVMQVWGSYYKPSMAKARSALDLLVGAEADWPFEPKAANSWVERCANGINHGVPCGKPVDHAKMHELSAHPVAVISDIAAIDLHDTKNMKAKIAAGQDVWFGARIGHNLASARLAGKPGSRYIPDFTPQTKDGGHAMLLVGYATLPHATYFLIHNSWGKHWADGGYAWIHEDTLKKAIGAAYVVDAQPAETEKSRRVPRKREHTICAEGLKPDSISTECVPPCPDGSPRHNAVCPAPSECAKGYVNLTGTCVRAAPSAKGHDGTSGITWVCGPGGCSYVVPNGTAGCGGGNPCMLSCPAPDYRLADGHRGLTCVE